MEMPDPQEKMVDEDWMHKLNSLTCTINVSFVLQDPLAMLDLQDLEDFQELQEREETQEGPESMELTENKDLKEKSDYLEVQESPVKLVLLESQLLEEPDLQEKKDLPVLWVLQDLKDPEEPRTLSMDLLDWKVNQVPQVTMELTANQESEDLVDLPEYLDLMLSSALVLWS